MASPHEHCWACRSLVDRRTGRLLRGAQVCRALSECQADAEHCRSCETILDDLDTDRTAAGIRMDDSALAESQISIEVHHPFLLRVTCWLAIAASYANLAAVERASIRSEPRNGRLFACFNVFYRAVPPNPFDPAVIPAEVVSPADDLLPKGRLLQRQLDTSLVRHWREICATKHPACSQIPGRSLKTQVRLVDTYRRCLVDGTTHLCYAALSYVWGRDTGSAHALQAGNCEAYYRPGSLRDLPQTLEDAIEIAADIGYQYLFVDALCILQSDAEDASLNIKKMDVIYGMADVTLVNAAGTTAHSSIPGSTSGPRSISPSLLIQEVRLLRANLDTCRTKTAARGSAWSNRAWTFQEQYLSRRLLILTKDRAVWECGAADWYEDMMEEEQLDWDECEEWRHGLIANRTCAHRLTGPSQLADSRSSIQRLFCQLVEEFSQRELTFDFDALSAFQGILRALANTPPFESFFWATPTKNLCTSLLWEPNEVENTLSRRFGGTGLEFEGSNIFPSWSWIAWRGGISYPHALRRRPTEGDNEEPCDFTPAVSKFFRASGADSEAMVTPDTDLPENATGISILGSAEAAEDVGNQSRPSTSVNSHLCNGILVFEALSLACIIGSDDRMLLNSCVTNARLPVRWRHKPAIAYQGEEISILMMATHSANHQSIRRARRHRIVSCLAVICRDGTSYRIGMCTMLAGDWAMMPLVPRLVALG